MNLTSDQQQAARACGITFVPATAIQVQHFTMQRRIFRIDDQPFMATRTAGFWETYGTLTRLIVRYEQDRRQQSAEVPVAAPEAAVAPLSDPALTHPAAEAASPINAEPAQQEVAQDTPRRKRAVRAGDEPAQEASRSVVTNEAAEPTNAASAEALPPAARTEAVTISNLLDGKPARAIRRRRIRRPQPPRWKTAGKARRGRLK